MLIDWMWANKGEIFALLAAATWGGALVLFRLSGKTMGPMVLNLFKNIVALVLLGLTLPFTDGLLGPLLTLSWWDLGLLSLSGVMGLAIADSLLFASLNRIGVTRITIIDCLYSPSVIFFSWMLLGEQIRWFHYVGALLVGLGILTSIERPPKALREEVESQDLWVGVLFGIGAMLSMAFGIVMAKPALKAAPLIWSTSFRLLMGSIPLAIWLLLSDRKALMQCFRPGAGWKYSLSGAILGSYLSMVFWVGGFKFAKASTAGLLNQSSMVFAFAFFSLSLCQSTTFLNFSRNGALFDK